MRGEEYLERSTKGCSFASAPFHDDHNAALDGYTAHCTWLWRWMQKRGGPLGLAVVGGLVVSQLITL